jgi:hypothetical protein
MTDDQRNKVDSSVASFMMQAVEEMEKLRQVMHDLRFEICYGKRWQGGHVGTRLISQNARKCCRALIHNLEMVEHCLCKQAVEEAEKPSRPPPSKPTLTPVA